MNGFLLGIIGACVAGLLIGIVWRDADQATARRWEIYCENRAHGTVPVITMGNRIACLEAK